MQGNHTFRAAIWVAAGGYLIYTAWQLATTGGHDTLMLILAAALGAAGAVVLLVGLGRLQQSARYMETALRSAQSDTDGTVQEPVVPDLPDDSQQPDKN